jgi:hypothetical protein
MSRLCALFLGLCACFPSFQDQGYLVEHVRILAVRGNPAEARPNTPVQYEALVARPQGEVLEAIAWSWCTTPRTAEERTGVTDRCARGQDLQPIAANTLLLADACSRFGPIAPPVQGNEQPRRPADPDPTGGYHLPVHAQVGKADAFGSHRIHCDLAGATRDIFEAYQEDYQHNLHPAIDALATPQSVRPGQVVSLSVRASEGSAEPFVVYVPERSVLVDRTETLNAWWYVTDGTLSRAQRRLSGGSASTQWTAPKNTATVLGWVVLRDSRGGMDWAPFELQVTP